MGKAPEKLAPWRNLVYLIVVVFAWAGYRIHRDYQQFGGWEARSVVSTAVTFGIFLIISVSVFWYANRPEREGQP